MFFFQFQSIIYRHAMSFHMENHLSLSRYKLFSIYSRSADILHTISGVKRARFGVENVGQPETVTITETVRMSSVLPSVLLLAWLVHWEFRAWSSGLRALQ